MLRRVKIQNGVAEVLGTYEATLEGDDLGDGTLRKTRRGVCELFVDASADFIGLWIGPEAREMMHPGRSRAKDRSRIDGVVPGGFYGIVQFLDNVLSKVVDFGNKTTQVN